MTVAEAIKAPQVAARGLMAPVGDGAQAFRVPGLPFLLEGAPVAA